VVHFFQINCHICGAAAAAWAILIPSPVRRFSLNHRCLNELFTGRVKGVRVRSHRWRRIVILSGSLVPVLAAARRHQSVAVAASAAAAAAAARIPDTHQQRRRRPH